MIISDNAVLYCNHTIVTAFKEVGYLRDNSQYIDSDTLLENGFIQIESRAFVRSDLFPKTKTIIQLNDPSRKRVDAKLIHSIGDKYLFLLQEYNAFHQKYNYEEKCLELNKDFIFDNTIDNFKLIDEL